MKIERRPAIVAEKHALRQMNHAAYREVLEEQFGSWDEVEEDRLFDEMWAGAPVEAILCDGHLAGYCSVEHHDDGMHIRELVVEPRYQRRGIGSAVLRDVIADAERCGVPVRLATHHANRAAALYERLGFTEAGRTETQRFFEWSPGR